MILAIADVKCAALDEDTVWPLETASERIAVGTIGAFAGADYGRNHSRPQIDSSNDVVFRVGYV